MSAVTAHISKYRTGSGIRYRVRITNRRLLRDAASYNRAGFRTRREAEEYARSIENKVARLERGEVGRVVFTEAMILTAISGLAGMALGAAIVWGFFRNGLDFSAIWDMEMEAAGVVIDPVIVPRFHWNQILQSLAFILVIGSLASIYPAWRATRIDVAEAMKFEE